MTTKKEARPGAAAPGTGERTGTQEAEESTRLEQALALAASGVPVFPCGPDKRPLVKKGFHAASTDEAQVRAWWSKWPDALIGRPAAGLVVIDCDLDPEKKKDGAAELYELERVHGELPSTYTVRTRRGGLHRYFNAPEGAKVKCSADVLAYGVDVRADGGYVIVPPSPGYTVEHDAPIADLPPAWIKLLAGERKKESTPEPEPKQEPPRAEHDAPDRNAVESALAKVSADCGYSRWIEVGQAIHDWMNGPLGLALWDQWSRTAPDRYEAGACATHWASFKAGGGVTIATLFHLAGGVPVQPYSTRGWAELGRLLLVPKVYWWGQTFALGELGVIFGQGGLGKSRMALNLSRNQVLVADFAGLPTGSKPLRHLHMGSENSIHRLQHDVRAMSNGLDQEQLALLDSNIRLATLENQDDPFITVANPANVKRWKATLEAFKPDVLWVDPWGDVLDGEANSDEDTRATLATLRRLLRAVNPEGSLVVLAHSRTGANNIAQAIGFDAANFGKGSKALYSAARVVWNLAPADETETPGVVCYCAKNNNGPRPVPFAVVLDPDTMSYSLDPDFDFDAWQDLVAQRAKGSRTVKRARLTAEKVMEIVGSRSWTMTEARQLLRDAGATRDEAEDHIKQHVLAGSLVQWRPPLKNTPIYVGTAAAIANRKVQVADQCQLKLVKA